MEQLITQQEVRSVSLVDSTQPLRGEDGGLELTIIISVMDPAEVQMETGSSP